MASPGNQQNSASFSADFFFPPGQNENQGYVMSGVGKDETAVVIHDRELPVTRHEKIEGMPGPLQFGVPYSDGVDPGVLAVSTALFAKNSIFERIPVKRRNIFRRRRFYEHNSEWSNSFPTFSDPCDCCTAVEEMT